MQKILFLDRDGCLIAEPPGDFQVDSLEKLEFMPGVIYALCRIVRELDYQLVLVSNQDGLGTASFPEACFWPAHNKMMQTFRQEGVEFLGVHLDRSFEYEHKPTRKPGTAMLEPYRIGYDLGNSFVVGDRLSDMELAQNLGAKGILLSPSGKLKSHTAVLHATHWEEIYQYLRLPPRTASIERKTKETHVEISLNLDGRGAYDISTQLGFFDHMLEQLARHGQFDLNIRTRGDLHIDEHHTVEDTALALGEVFLKALGDKSGIERYGFCLPMDDSLAQVALDFGGRPWLVWDAPFRREKIGDLPTELFKHFFKSFSDAAKCNLNIKCRGENEHHKIEAIFKAFAKSLKMSVKRDPHNRDIPTTKGVL